MDWQEVFKGIQLCIGFQLLLLAIFKLTSQQKRNYILGLYTILISISSLSSGLYTYIEYYPILHIFFGAHLIMFHAPLLFLYIKALGDKKLNEWHHFVFPITYILVYLLFKHYLTDFFYEYDIQLLILHLAITVIYTGCYFYAGSKHFNLKLNDTLRQKALTKFRLFYVVTNIHSITLDIVMIISYITFLYFHNELLYVNENIIPNVLSFIIYIHPLTSIIFMGYLLSEAHSFKYVFLDNEAITKSATIQHQKQFISKEIKRVIDIEKRFTNADFNLKQLSNEIGINSKELAEYFNEELSTSFNDYLYRKKIEEFKNLVRQDTEGTYSLLGLAELAGFKSKATFYRIFKKVEGVTPSQYKEQLAQFN